MRSQNIERTESSNNKRRITEADYPLLSQSFFTKNVPPSYHVISEIKKPNPAYNESNKNDNAPPQYIKCGVFELERVIIGVIGSKPELIKKRADFSYGIKLATCAAREKMLKTKTITLNDTVYHIVSEVDARLSQSKGVVFNYDLTDESDVDILFNLKSQKVVRVDRIKKKGKDGNFVDTGLFIFTFDTPVLPAKMMIASAVHAVRQHYDRPMQCRTCWKFGHTWKRCNEKNKHICFNCGNECNLGLACENERKCVNCGEKHCSTSKECPMRNREELIIKIATDRKISFRDARDLINENENNQSNSFSNSIKVNETLNNQKQNTTQQNKQPPTATQQQQSKQQQKTSTSTQQQSTPSTSHPPSAVQKSKLTAGPRERGRAAEKRDELKVNRTQSETRNKDVTTMETDHSFSEKNKEQYIREQFKQINGK